VIKKPGFFPFFKKKPEPLPKNLLPKIRTKSVPGPESKKMAESLRRFECPAITFVNDFFPIFIKKAHACNMTDVDGNRYLDLTSAFAVSGVGHTSPAVARAMREQSHLMIHGMGDVHPNEVKVLLAKRLSEITPGNLNQSIFSSTGSEAVESALKTAVMHTKKTGVIAFEGAYHGLGYGSLEVTHRSDFKKPFEKQLTKFAQFAPYPNPRLYGSKASEVSMKAIESIYSKAKRSKHPIGAVLIEPIQGRGGIIVPPPNFFKDLRAFCDKNSVLLIVDEIFTGFARTGTLFAIEKSGIVPDILCLGKGMGGGFPISACIGTTRVMHSWGSSTGDAIHTSTYLGNPLGCAIALAVIKEIEEKKFVDRSKQMGELFRRKLHDLKLHHPIIADVRGAGLMIGVEFSEPSQDTPKKNRKPVLPVPATTKAKNFMLESLRRGLILLPSGPDHNVISLTPPFVITEKEIEYTVSQFDKILKNI
jgi:4-aminobutyrate aminotransferase / (S)-3-amino-2-methylpropionate transaminase / 5-aminovalerate transaminase